MRVICIALLSFSIVSLAASPAAAVPDTLWTRYIGTPGTDYGYSVKQTADGGFVLTGVTYSSGDGDVYLLKVDAGGDSLWSRTYGGPAEDAGRYVSVCADGGYVIAGYTYSYGAGDADLFLIRTDAGGDTIWTRVYGGADYDEGACVIQTDEGGFLAVGHAESWWIRSEAWIIKTDADGDSVWTRRFGEVNNTYAYEAVETTLGGQTYSVGGACRGLYTSNNFYLIRMEEDGDTLWTGAYGGTGWDDCHGLDRTDDLGFVLAGRTTSFGALGWDYYVVRADAGGDTIWHRIYGGSGYDYAYSVKETPDGGYIIVGETDSYGHGSVDAYAVKVDANGDSIWTRAFGSTQIDRAYEVRLTSDNGYIIGGYGYDHSGGGYDFYLIRIGPEASAGPAGPRPDMIALRAHPNPFASSVSISYSLCDRSRVSVDVYDIRGRCVATPLSGIIQDAGRRTVSWNGRGHRGAPLPPGIYFFRLQTGSVQATQKLVLLY